MTTSARYYALMPGGYPDTRDDYASCETMGEALEILEEARPFLSDPAVHVFDGGREPWSEYDPYPDYVVLLDGDGVPTVRPA